MSNSQVVLEIGYHTAAYTKKSTFHTNYAASQVHQLQLQGALPWYLSFFLLQ